MNLLIEQFRKYGYISTQIENSLLEFISEGNKKKNDFYLKQGQINSSLFVIKKGLVRGFFKKDEKEIVSWFGKEDELIASILPLYSNKPSFENIQFIEDTTYYSISAEDLNTIYLRHPEFNLIGRKVAQALCEFLEERIISLQIYSAEERYRYLLSKNPDLFRRVNLGYIASYLGITQETLSRIRSRF